jgi:hypothetical protein
MSLELARSTQQTLEHIIERLRHAEVADDHRRDHLRIVTGPQPYRHSYYSRDQFLFFDACKGTIQTVYGQRAFLTTGNFFRSLVEVLAGHGDSRVDELLEKIGRNWSEAMFRDLVPRVEQEFEIQFDKMSLGMVIQTWWWPMRACGWGDCHVDLRHSRKGLVRIEVRESALVRAMGQVGRPICSWYAGMFAGIFSKLARRELSAVEVSCAAAGADRCVFLVGNPARIRDARQARDEGSSVETIIERWLAHRAERVSTPA